MKYKNLLLLIAGSLTAGLGYAQEGAAENQEEVFELSPFTVDASSDMGYQATQSQAGTRVRAELRDIASSISVMNSELLEDIGAKDLQDALVYSVSTENEFEYAPNDGEGESVSTLIQSRTRGLVSSTTSRNFFTSNLRMDGYNTERITLARGPNSILFGLGSPAGIIDGTLKRARLNKFFGSVSAQIDSFDGSRQVLQLNIPVIDDFLAIRVAGLNQEKRTYKEPEMDDEKRKYITATLRPWKGATMRGYYEKVDITRVLGRHQLANDYISDWIAEGSPLYRYDTKEWTYDNGATWEAWRGVNGYPEPVKSDHKFVVYVTDGVADYDVSIWDSVVPKAGQEDYPAALKQHGIQALNYWDMPESYNRNMPDKTFGPNPLIPTDINFNGENSRTDFNITTRTFTYEQQFTDKLFAEVAYNKEIYDNWFFDAFRGENIYADVLYYIPFTAPINVDSARKWRNAERPLVQDANGDYILVENPNRGQFYSESQSIGRDQTMESETLRATISYELDLTDVNRWLGRYNLAAMWQTDEDENLRIKTRHYGLRDSRLVGDARNGANGIVNRAYLNIPGLSSGSDAPIYPGKWVLPSEAGYDWWDSEVVGAHDDGKPELTGRETESFMGVVQAYWDLPFGDSLVGTYGYRQDNVDIWDGVGTSRDSAGIWQLENFRLPDEPIRSLKGITRTTGLVYHSPIDGLSFFYNQSDSFDPQTNKKNIYGDFLEGQNGEGKDWGFMIEAFDRKLSLRFSAYENNVNGGVENNYSWNRIKDTFVQQIENRIQSYIKNEAQAAGLSGGTPEFDEYVQSHPDYFNRYTKWDNRVLLSRDYKSEGYELELFARPMKGMDVRLTVAKAEATYVSMFPNLKELVNSRWDVWTKYFDDYWSHGGRVEGDYLPDWATNDKSIGYQLYNHENRFPLYYQALAFEGGPNHNLRKWRANLIVNYRFRNDTLRGLSVGGGARWRDKTTVGFMPKNDPNIPDNFTVPDVTKPIEGEDQLFFDIWFKYKKKIRIGGHKYDWTLYFKVANPFESSKGKIVPYEASYLLDGAYSKYQVEAVRKFTLSSSLSF